MNNMQNIEFLDGTLNATLPPHTQEDMIRNGTETDIAKEVVLLPTRNYIIMII